MSATVIRALQFWNPAVTKDEKQLDAKTILTRTGAVFLLTAPLFLHAFRTIGQNPLISRTTFQNIAPSLLFADIPVRIATLFAQLPLKYSYSLVSAAATSFAYLHFEEKRAQNVVDTHLIDEFAKNPKAIHVLKRLASSPTALKTAIASQPNDVRANLSSLLNNTASPQCFRLLIDFMLKSCQEKKMTMDEIPFHNIINNPPLADYFFKQPFPFKELSNDKRVDIWCSLKDSSDLTAQRLLELHIDINTKNSKEESPLLIKTQDLLSKPSPSFSGISLLLRYGAVLPLDQALTINGTTQPLSEWIKTDNKSEIFKGLEQAATLASTHHFWNEKESYQDPFFFNVITPAVKIDAHTFEVKAGNIMIQAFSIILPIALVAIGAGASYFLRARPLTGLASTLAGGALCTVLYCRYAVKRAFSFLDQQAIDIFKKSRFPNNRITDYIRHNQQLLEKLTYAELSKMDSAGKALKQPS